MAHSELLCVDPDPQRRSATLLAVADAVRHADAVAVGSPETAIEHVHGGTVGVVTTHEFPGSDLTGVDLLRRVREHDPSVACLLLTAEDADPDVSSVPGGGVEVTTVDDDLRSHLLLALEAVRGSEVPLPADEEARLAHLRTYPLTDEGLVRALDRLVTLADGYFDTLFVNVHVVERDEQHSLACRGPEPLDADRADSVCTYAILSEDVTVVEDLSADERFADHEYVHEYDLGGYAGAPIRSPAGHALGTFCLLDDDPLDPTDGEREALALFAAEAADQFEYHRLRTRGDGGQGGGQ